MRRSVRLKHIKHRKNRKGRVAYVYYAPPGREWVRLPNLPENHPDFIRAYADAAVNASPSRSNHTPTAGSFGDVIVAYKASAAWKSLAPSTRGTRGRILDKLREKGGDVPVAGLREKHIRNDLRSLGPNPYNQRLKVWKALLRFALVEGFIDTDPAEKIKKISVSTDGHHTWTHHEIEQFRAAHPYGTKARVALELAFWTGARRADLVRLGYQMIDDSGWLRFKQNKTGGDVEIPFLSLPDRCASLAEDHQHLILALRTFEARPGQLLFLETARGAAHSDKAFGNWFHDHVKTASLPDGCTLHGLRKSRASDLAEKGFSTHQIGAWTGHSTLSEIDRYAKKASRRRMLEGSEQERNSGKHILRFSQTAPKAK